MGRNDEATREFELSRSLLRDRNAGASIAPIALTRSTAPDLFVELNRLRNGGCEMTSVLKPIAESFRSTNFVLGLCLGDMKDGDARKRVRNGTGPSIAWEVGHMLAFRCMALKLLGSGKEDPYAAKYAAVGASDGSDYPGIPEYQRQWEQVYAELERALDAATPESLERVIEDDAHGAKPALDSIVFLTWHEAYHVGALAAIRKELGYPGPAELVLAKVPS
jgi:uncharacterized damage-inducible protein DinB